MFPILYIQVYFYKVRVKKKPLIDDIYSIENGLLKKNITEELQLKNIFSIDKNAGLGILKDTGKTLITNYMYNVPLIEMAFVLNLQHATHFRVHVQSRNTSNLVTDTPLLNKIQASKEKNDSVFFVYCEVRFI